MIADTKQPEIDYQQSNGSEQRQNVSSYQGTGGVQLNSFLKRAAFAIRFGDLNVLISDLVTPSSRMMFVRDIQTGGRQGRAVPESGQRSRIRSSSDGQIDWVQDAYTTTETIRTHRTPTRARCLRTAD